MKNYQGILLTLHIAGTCAHHFTDTSLQWQYVTVYIAEIDREEFLKGARQIKNILATCM